MRKFISKNIHWLLGILLLMSLISFSFNIDSTPDVVTLIVGIISFISVLYLAFHVEFKKGSNVKNKIGENE